MFDWSSLCGYVSSVNPNANYGSATPLLATLNQSRALLRLKTAGLVPAGQHATSAKLMLYTTNDVITTGGFQVHNESGSWTASTVTWNTQPAWDNNVIATSPTPHAGQWVTINLPLSSVNLSGDTTYGFSYSDANSGAAFASREDSSHAPQLVVTYSGDVVTGPIMGLASKCLDDRAGALANGNKIELWACNGDPASQDWTVHAAPASPIEKGNGYCLDVKGAGTTPGTLVQLYTCNGSSAQQWTINSNGTIVNPHSGLCLDDEHSVTTNGNQIWVYTCNGTNAQKWTTPL